ncbi:MAG: RNA polymerase sigma factor, partial [Myxococcales bacterium]|nr:RNA polymerase sigma factor [Myxococcales bacterium]
MTSSVAIAQRLRELAPQVLATVLRRHPRDLTTAEDAVQEALLAAATQWPAAGLPENPGAWLVRVALRRVADHVRAELARRRREALVVSQLPGEPPAAPAPDDDGTAGLVDDTLPLLFMCCHPALTRPSAIALTLRAVGGLTTREIARAFLVPEATMAQRVSRAKETIRASGVALELPGGAELAARRDGVLHVLYLVFNEGYAASEGEDLARVDLSREAIRLARLLARLAPGDPEVEGLLALMLLTDARRPARTGPSGELVPLDEQDRALWDRALVAEGTALVETAFARGAVGPYQLQAA